MGELCHQLLLTLIASIFFHEAASFLLPPQATHHGRVPNPLADFQSDGKTYHPVQLLTQTPHIHCVSPSSTKLNAALLPNLPSVFSKVSPPLRNSLLLGTAAVAIYKNRQKLFYPGSAADPSFSEPLPPGSLGCPLFGNLGFFTKNGTPEKGPGQFFALQAESAKSPSIFKFMTFFKPITMVSGMKNVKAAFNTEFKKINTGILIKRFLDLFGEGSLMLVTDAERHKFLRKLLGQAMTPEAIEIAMPALVKGANLQIDSLATRSDLKMEEVLTDFTLDVAWRQILGLDLKEDEITTFNAMVDDWVNGMVNMRTLILPGFQRTKAAKALKYLVSKIDRRIDELNKNGPDASTLSSMVFAADDEDKSKKLSREEIISNSLLLIAAGSETAASTLTVAVLALGLHKDVFKKLKEEQDMFVSKYGEELKDRDLLDECPYLDAVIKETMRIKPFAGLSAVRFAKETIVVDGKQIPKGYGVAFNIYLTHANDPVVKTENDSHMDITLGFSPERWLSKATEPKEFMPFGYGQRFCLGANLAMAEMKVFLSLFARRVDFDLVNMKPGEVTWQKASIVPKPADGAVISVSRLRS